MFLTKKRAKRETAEQFTLGDVELKVARNSEVYKQVQMIGLTAEDLIQLKRMHIYVLNNIGGIVDRFYKNLENEPSLLGIIQDNSSIERLKKTLRTHIGEMFAGEINREFLEKRIRIAHVHVKIGLQTKWYMCAFQDLLLSLLGLIEDNFPNKEEHMPLIRAVSKILNLEQQLVLEAYDAESDRIKAEGEQEKLLIRQSVAEASENLAAISEETNQSFQDLVGQSNDMIIFAKKGADLSNLAEERALQGKQQINMQAATMENIHHKVNEITGDVHVLLSITNQMAEIINIVKGIAEQTNLLSLNAAIEAAKAGEHGLGFSVVAGEVRKLSDDTKKSVANVATLIQNTNGQTEKLTSSLDKIMEEISKGNKSMQETAEHFQHILEAMCETKGQNNRIDEKLASFIQLINEMGSDFKEVAVSADKLTWIAKEME
ncbi:MULTISPECIES: globin-coupled sensor protein [unclassified Niallia]|uniref:globin-coupled sensor protein n=2 Tax=Bacillaceae TaxID=186817 RepID=UPI001EDC2C3D|nr:MULTISPECIES: globin-coupled sensor protein [unclassified Niallia]MDL0436112.1 globin-coupled sensor protein [Niallia sp. SS-2023]UPO86149.1 globin-coupled sensor protein [Niallia sp. Man26]